MLSTSILEGSKLVPYFTAYFKSICLFSLLNISNDFLTTNQLLGHWKAYEEAYSCPARVFFPPPYGLNAFTYNRL